MVFGLVVAALLFELTQQQVRAGTVQESIDGSNTTITS